jgi:hypothetical protein
VLLDELDEVESDPLPEVLELLVVESDELVEDSEPDVVDGVVAGVVVDDELPRLSFL